MASEPARRARAGLATRAPGALALAVALVLSAAAGCDRSSPRPEPAREPPVTGQASTGPLDRAAVAADVSARWLAGLVGRERAEGAALVDELVASWADEADTDADPRAVNAIQRQDLDAAGVGAPPAERLRTLRIVVLARLVTRLRVRTYALGRAIIDGEVARADAPARGRPLLAEAEQLAARLQAAGDAAQQASIRQGLEDALLEALFAIEGKAMSGRLSRYAGGRGGGPAVTP